PRRGPAHPEHRRDLPGRGLARAGDLGHVRRGLRRPPGADPHPHAGRLGRAPAAQGLPAGRDPRGVQGRHRPAARRAEVVQLMATHTGDSGVHSTPGADDYAEGHIVDVPASGDFDREIGELGMNPEERIILNRGPQHPSTHGVLRIILELDGETVTEARAGIGYLHTGIEKNMEFRTWTQGVTFCTRMDYLSPMFQETAYCLGIEKLLGITDDIPERA